MCFASLMPLMSVLQVANLRATIEKVRSEKAAVEEQLTEVGRDQHYL